MPPFGTNKTNISLQQNFPDQILRNAYLFSSISLKAFAQEDARDCIKKYRFLSTPTMPALPFAQTPYWYECALHNVNRIAGTFLARRVKRSALL